MKFFSIGLGVLGLFIIFHNGFWFWKGVTTQEQLIVENHSSPLKIGSDQSFNYIAGEPFGTLSIPALELNLPILQGTSENELKKGVGHYEKSARPGENRHIVLAGHRDTFFRKLEHVKVGDDVQIQMFSGTFVYRVNKTKIVNKENRSILVEKPVETLTLVTCYPFQYFGNAPDRFIVTAKLVAYVKSNVTNLTNTLIMETVWFNLDRSNHPEFHLLNLEKSHYPIENREPTSRWLPVFHPIM